MGNNTDMNNTQTMKSQSQVEGIRRVVEAMELPLLIFPVVVVMVVALTFFFPQGKCAAWQWWGSVAIIIVMCFIRAKSFKSGILVSVMFGLFLLMLWIGCNIFMTLPNNDIDRCHGPAVLMLIEGWNPLWDGDLEKISQSLAISKESFSFYHIIPMHKCTHYFSAAAFPFTRTVFNLFAPLSFFLFAGLVYAIFRFFKSVPFWLRIVGVILSYTLSPCADQLSDMTVCVAGIWLLVSMYGSLRSCKIHIMHLAIPTFWMAAAKPSGLLHCVVFWLAFVAVFCVKKRRCIMHSLVPFFISLGLLVIVVSSPYVTSWIYFSHPLYPKLTSDENRFPSKNIVNDFLNRNEDANQMGRVGSWVNAFVSPQVARGYYNVKLGRDDFFPQGKTWSQGGNSVPNGAPTSIKTRIMFLLPIVVLLCFACRRRLENVFVVSCLVCGTMFMPYEMIGYVRYVPWYFAGAVFCIPAFYECTNKVISISGLSLVILCAMFFLFPSLMLASISMDYNNATRNFLERETIPVMIVASQNARRPIPEDIWHSGFVMLQKWHVTALRNAKVLTFPSNLPDAQNILDRWAECELFYNNSFRVPPGTNLKKYSLFRRTVQDQSHGVQHMITSAQFVVRTFVVTMPQSIWCTLFG